MCVARHTQITQNNKFPISLQYLKKEVSGEADFLHADKHESFLQIDTKILMGMVSISKAHKIVSLQFLNSTSREKLEMKLIFCTQICIKISYKFISRFWTSQFPARWYSHYWWAWTSILKVLKVTSLQYLYNISKKEVKDGVHFLHAEKTIKTSSGSIVFVTRHVRIIQSRKLVIFLQNIKKKV